MSPNNWWKALGSGKSSFKRAEQKKFVKKVGSGFSGDEMSAVLSGRFQKNLGREGFLAFIASEVSPS